ncbi:MAG: DUF2309 domain-containing protein [Nitrospirae bacterium]|nr:DUF2309 domain-containing protein [Nitrospirota bacterium]MCL5285219.1 DUF2309 domain-containing protein [Nitrospirota bacterium]
MTPSPMSRPLSESIDRACRRIAPLWPLKHFVAVSPYFGLVDKPWEEAHRTLARVAGTGLFMPRSYFREQIRTGRITAQDLTMALRECGSSLKIETLLGAIGREAPPVRPAPLLVGPLRGEIEGRAWEDFVVDRISPVLASWFDMGQALWKNPWKGQSLFSAWKFQARIDRTPRLSGLRGVPAIVDGLPEEPEKAIASVMEEIPLPGELTEDRLHAALLSVGGWAAWARYRLWQAELSGTKDTAMVDLLAIRMAWERILFRTAPEETLARLRERRLAKWLEGQGSEKAEEAFEREIDQVLQTAFEIGYRKSLFARLGGEAPLPPETGAPAAPRALAVFCIDVRSEVFRRALERVAPGVETAGFAGFFGIPAAVRSIGTAGARAHLPVLFSPAYQIEERPASGARDEAGRLESRREIRLGTGKAWKIFKTSASSAFAFVESAGILSAGKLLANVLGIGAVAPPPRHRGLREDERKSLVPDLDGIPGETGIPPAERPRVAAAILRNMGLVGRFPRIVLLVGHGSTTANNPQASALDCGACAGQSGEASARIAAALLNDPGTRQGLREAGLTIPEETFFLPALHDTTTDSVTLFGEDRLPESRQDEIARLREDFVRAGAFARAERAVLFGGRSLERDGLEREVSRRGRDWSEVRPEWGLANNASFIVAPRRRTAGRDLSGRAFLHDYDWQKDPDFETLELILTAPLIVGHWINMQYYGSVVDNRRFGSGNKVLHNVVGGAIGVLEGNGGDLRTGLALQSLHDGRRFVHEPLRLQVLVEAPRDPIDRIVGRHALLRNLMEGGWMPLFRLVPGEPPERRTREGQWVSCGLGERDLPPSPPEKMGLTWPK